jgi:hypothetical protein
MRFHILRLPIAVVAVPAVTVAERPCADSVVSFAFAYLSQSAAAAAIHVHRGNVTMASVSLPLLEMFSHWRLRKLKTIAMQSLKHNFQII